MTEQSKESTVKENLHEVKEAIDVLKSNGFLKGEVVFDSIHVQKDFKDMFDGMRFKDD